GRLFHNKLDARGELGSVLGHMIDIVGSLIITKSCREGLRELDFASISFYLGAHAPHTEEGTDQKSKLQQRRYGSGCCYYDEPDFKTGGRSGPVYNFRSFGSLRLATVCLV